MPRAKPSGICIVPQPAYLSRAERRAPWSSIAPLLPPQPGPASLGWGASGRRNRRGRKEALSSSKHRGGISCACYVNPLLSQAIAPYQDEQASLKAIIMANQGEGRVYGNGLWKNDKCT